MEGKKNAAKRVKTPTVLQMEAVECGAASLSIILGTFEKFVALEELRVECGVSRDGSKANNIVKAARKFGLDAKGFKYKPERIYDQTMPCIVWWNRNHFLVVEGVKGDTVFLNDPASGPRTCSFSEFVDSYSHVLLTFSLGSDFEKGGNRPSLLAGLIPRMQSYKPAVSYFVVSAIFLVIPGLAVPGFTRIFIDEIIVSNRFDWVRPLLFGMSVTALLTMVLTYVQEFYLLRYQCSLALSESSRFFFHILRLPTTFFSQRFGGEIGQRVQINDKIAEVVAEKLPSMAVDLLKTGTFGFLMFFYDTLLCVATIGLGLINFAVLKLVARKRVDSSRKLLQDEGKLVGTAMGGLQMIETIKATGGEDEFFSRWAGYQAKTLTSKQTLGAIMHSTSALPVVLNAATTAVILGLGGFRVMSGEMTVGMLVAFQVIAQNFTKPFANIVAFGGEVQELQGDMARIDDVLNHPKDPIYLQESKDVLKGTVKLSGFLEINKLTFGYNPLGKPLIEDFSLSIKPGQRVALVGGSGSGKSTIAKLVAGLYQPWSGSICFDGVDRSDLPPDLINNSIAVIDQEVFTFEGTIRDNLTMWDATVPERQVTEALRDSCLLDVVSQRPGGVASRVEEGGGNFSGGQRQRLEIARALLGQPNFLVLDEATSALDPATEKEIERNLMRRACSCLIVAHRLSTIRDCDEIIVMDAGEIVERGNHETLLAQGGKYAELIEE